MVEGISVWNSIDFLNGDLESGYFALVVLNQPIVQDPDLVKSLWKKAKIKITVDGGSNRWLNFIEQHSAQSLSLPDYITGDFDSITESTRKYFQGKNVTFVHTPDQDETDFTKALRKITSIAISKQVKLNHVIALSTNSGRLDQIMANCETLHTSQRFLLGVPVILMSSCSLTWLLPPGNHLIEVPEKYVHHAYSVGLIPLCGSTNVTTSGLKWNLENQKLAFGELVSTSNTYSNQRVKIKCDKNLIWTMQYTEEEPLSKKRLMGSMFRTEEMALCQLFIQPEAAYSSVSILGEEGTVQFRDLNANVNAFRRKFVGEVRRCDEMERKLRYIEAEVNKDGVKIPECEDVPRAPNPREIIDLEARLEKTESEILELSNNAVNLQASYLELMEFKHVLEKTQVFFTEPIMQHDETSESLTKSLINEENVASQVHRGRLGFVAGVVPRERVPAFERMLWRISRGNVFLRQTTIENPLQDPMTRNEIYKTVFVAFFQGEELKTRVQKVCTGFHASLYPCPSSVVERQEMLKGVCTRLEDLNLVLNQTEDHRQRVLVSVAKELQNWNIMVRKMKAIYHTLNMFNMDVTKKCLIGECWVPVSDLKSVQNALVDGGKAGGSSIPSFLNIIEANGDPPTYNRTNKFTRGFQNLIDAYGISCYREVNPALYTMVTFPFLFAIMFGDSGHGIILTVFAACMILKEKQYKKKKFNSEIGAIFFGGRYIILLMGLFSIYTGFIYNDVFSKSLNIFGSSWTVGYDDDVLVNEKDLTLNPATDDYIKYPYPVGLDPVWQLASSNKIIFLNAFKMKLSIIFGVVHMIFGVCLSVVNHVYFNKKILIIIEFIPQILFLSVLFLYLVALIFLKWILYSADAPFERSTRCAPSILVLFINMMLFKRTPPQDGCNEYMFEGQDILQKIFIFTALICIPMMLFGKPIYVFFRSRRWKQDVERNGDLGQAFELQTASGDTSQNSGTNDLMSHSGHDGNFGEVMILQAIHTIEYVLSTVSHTASYLRLWALSLAHSQLSDVLWSRVLHMGLVEDSYLAVPMLFAIFAIWAFFTITILVMMEGLSAFLHTLRLHWVEFMSKFYTGSGYPFVPFSFKNILEREETEED